MKKTVLFLMIFSILLAFACADKKVDKSKAKKEAQKPESVVDMEPVSPPSNPEVIVKTSMGDFYVELFEQEAPITVKNFLNYVNEKYYDETIFHRVISSFMVQGGGFTQNMAQKPTEAPIKNEADNGLKNVRGTLAMARTNVVDSATSQFFINVVDNHFLDHGGRDFGYAVFGKVTTGMDVIDKIRNVQTHNVAGHGDVPVKPVIIKSIRKVDK